MNILGVSAFYHLRLVRQRFFKYGRRLRSYLFHDLGRGLGQRFDNFGQQPQQDFWMRLDQWRDGEPQRREDSGNDQSCKQKGSGQTRPGLSLPLWVVG